MSLIENNLRLVRDRIDSAARRAGRSGSDVTLVVVTKTRSIDEIRQAVECGATDIGENYVQESEEKFSTLGKVAKWHMIGHLQRNKARHVVEFADLIHSVDNEALAKEIGRRAEAIGRIIDVLIEVNISGEESKFGVEPDEALRLAERIAEITGIRLCGLMGMAPFLPDAEGTRPYFRKLKQAWDKLPDEQRLYLSMGMTHDFEIAVEEGSNMVRIGTAIFGPRA
ncbi:YggS family pyridoxal phosphate-dependent enzyme [bacterium]|nr:YggS family pyridoxal phosphate-dependent enzyme [bacterium]